MKKIVAFAFASIIMVQSFAAVSVELPARKKASEVMFPIGNTGKFISLLDLATMSPKDYQNITGQHLKFSERVAFKIGQKELKTTINPDGTVNAKKLETLSKKMQKASTDDKKNLRLALIFAGAAIILTILGGVSSVFWVLASIAWLIAVVFFIIWLVNMAK